jgi:hypothetical protein
MVEVEPVAKQAPAEINRRYFLMALFKVLRHLVVLLDRGQTKNVLYCRALM